MTTRPQQDARAIAALIGMFALALTAITAGDVATLLRVPADAGPGAPVVHSSRGVLEAARVSRKPVFRLPRPGEGPLTLTCPDRALVDHLPCPPEDADWSARAVVVDWIDVPCGLAGETVQRATRIAAADRVVFAAPLADVLAAERRAAWWSIARALAIFAPAVLLFAGVGALVRRQRLAAQARVEATRQRIAHRS